MCCKCCEWCPELDKQCCMGRSHYSEQCKRCEDYPLKNAKSLEKSNETEKNERGRE